MNREQRRKIKKNIKNKADEIWKLEVLATLAKDESVKATAQQAIEKITATCNMSELLLIDAYINETYAKHS
jgi:hypothetical protein